MLFFLKNVFYGSHQMSNWILVIVWQQQSMTPQGTPLFPLFQRRFKGDDTLNGSFFSIGFKQRTGWPGAWAWCWYLCFGPTLPAGNQAPSRCWTWYPFNPACCCTWEDLVPILLHLTNIFQYLVRCGQWASLMLVLSLRKDRSVHFLWTITSNFSCMSPCKIIM